MLYFQVNHHYGQTVIPSSYSVKLGVKVSVSSLSNAKYDDVPSILVVGRSFSSSWAQYCSLPSLRTYGSVA